MQNPDRSVSFITGAGRGIGRAIASALAWQGSAVVLAARTAGQLDEAAGEIKASGGTALPVVTDVTDATSVHRAVDRAIEEFGHIDLLVNNAGSNNGSEHGAVGPLWEIDADAWWQDVKINLLGALLCSQAVLRHMVPRRSGRIINVSAMSAARPAAFHSAYACSKAGMVRLTDSLAAEVAEEGISVFALSPGAIQTDLTTGLLNTPAGRRWLGSVKADIETRWLSPEVPARMIVMLASGRADALSGRFVRSTDDLDDLIDRASEIIERDVKQLRYADL